MQKQVEKAQGFRRWERGLRMVRQLLTGTRIRERRLDIGMRQADLAQVAGISPSYLNLIEHNKRRIGGALLGALARALGVEPGALSEGADLVVLDALRAIVADATTPVEADRMEELAARYPGWTAMLAAQAQRIAQLETHLQALSDRMSHDPQLATALHDVITAVTSIQSTADILVGDDRLDADWQRRFHVNIHGDSKRLATLSQSLVSYLNAPKADGMPALTPMEEVEALLLRDGFGVPAIEADPQADIAKIIAQATEIQSKAGAEIAQSVLQRYARDATAMPMQRFAQAARDFGYDPARLAMAFDVDLAAVLRRMAHLSVADGHPPMGLAVCDAAGVVTLFKPVPGFVLPRNGAACPLWPLYAALSQPGRPGRQVVTLPDTGATRLLCFAIALPKQATDFDTSPIFEATMLVMPDPPEGHGPPQPVGMSCRACPRASCAARREPSVMAGIPQML